MSVPQLCWNIYERRYHAILPSHESGDPCWRCRSPPVHRTCPAPLVGTCRPLARFNFIMYALVAFGVTVGYHRMLTHRSFRPHPIVKCLLLLLGSMSVEGPALQWAATHVKHHALSDREGDPHSPVDGFFHAHIGWLFGDDDGDPNRYCPQLVKDRLVVFMSRTFWLWAVLGMVIPLLLGDGLACSGVVWCGSS